MSLEEAMKLNKEMQAKGISKIDMDPAKHFKAYDSLNPKTKGYDKKDVMTGQAIFDKLRDWRITDDEVDMFYPLGEQLYYDWVDEADEESIARKMFDDFVQNGTKKSDNQKAKKMFDDFDKDHNGRINKREWRAADKAHE
jgi:hypothetical protein